MQAAFRLWMAITKVELGRLAEAWLDLRAAEAELLTDPKLGLICEAARIRLLAHQGDREQAVQDAEMLLGRLDQLTIGPSTRLECLELLGRALFELGESEQAGRFWQHDLSGTHPPIAEPTGHYFLGECRLQLDDPDGALEEFRRATALRIDSHHTRLAEQRIRELSLDPAGSS